MSGVDLIAQERERHVAEEGWTADHDARHEDGELAVAAACYAMPGRLYVEHREATRVAFVDPWPFPNIEYERGYFDYDKRKQRSNVVNFIPTKGPERIRMLARAGALIAAEIDRLTRP